jgi:hypothetical protein
MILETHLHTYLGSQCGKLSPALITNLYGRKGYDGIVITEHFSKSIFNDFYPKGSYEEKIGNLLLSYNQACKEAEKFKMKVFLGIEVGFSINGKNFEFLIYGIDKDFLLANNEIYFLTQKQLFALCVKNQLFMAQAHPFRNNIQVGNPLYMHGVEVYNGNKRHNNHNLKALAFAKKNNLIQISGSDFHQKEDLGLGGIIIPDNIENDKQLAAYLLSNQPKLIKNGRMK